MLPNDVVFVGAPIQRRLVGVVLGKHLRGGYCNQTNCKENFEIGPHKSSKEEVPAQSWVEDRPCRHCTRAISSVFTCGCPTVSFAMFRAPPATEGWSRP